MTLENMKKKISCPLGGASDLFTFFIIGNESVPRSFFFQLFLTFSESLGPWLSMFKIFTIRNFFFHKMIFFSCDFLK